MRHGPPSILKAGRCCASFCLRSLRESTCCCSALTILIVDFWSLAVLIGELGQFYEAEIENRPAALEPRVPLYRDYVRRQEELLRGPDGERLRKYWLQKLAGELPVLDLPTDRARPSVQTYRGASVSARLDQSADWAAEASRRKS